MDANQLVYVLWMECKIRAGSLIKGEVKRKDLADCATLSSLESQASYKTTFLE